MRYFLVVGEKKIVLVAANGQRRALDRFFSAEADRNVQYVEEVYEGDLDLYAECKRLI